MSDPKGRGWWAALAGLAALVIFVLLALWLRPRGAVPSVPGDVAEAPDPRGLLQVADALWYNAWPMGLDESTTRSEAAGGARRARLLFAVEAL